MKINRTQKPSTGDERVITKFAILPITATNGRGQKETRWLEKVTVVQIFNPQDSMRESWVSARFK